MARMTATSSPEDIAAFENEMRTAGVDWQLIKYGGAVHAFTQPTRATTIPKARLTTKRRTNAPGKP